MKVDLWEEDLTIFRHSKVWASQVSKVRTSKECIETGPTRLCSGHRQQACQAHADHPRVADAWIGLGLQCFGQNPQGQNGHSNIEIAAESILAFWPFFFP